MKKANQTLHCVALMLIVSIASPEKTPVSAHSSFLQCLQNSSLPSLILSTAENPNYLSIFFSSIQNNRTLLNSPKPLVIVTPTQASHVSSVVLCSKQLQVPLRTRSGGHDFEGLSYTSTTSSFVLLDLLNLRSVNVDLSDGGGTAWVDAGATLGELYYAVSTESNNTLAFPAGLCPTVGVGGHFSGGGLGTLMRVHGLAVDNIVDARVVNANGEILDRESMGEELFWAIRGGGGASFGVILSFKLKLVQVPPMVTVFSVEKSLQQGAIKLLSKWQQIAHKLDERVFIRVVMRVANVDYAKFAYNKTIIAKFECLFLGEAKQLLLLMANSFPELGLQSNDCLELNWIRSVLYFANYRYDGPLDKLLDRHPQSSLSFKKKSDFLREPVGEEEWAEISTWLVEHEENPTIVIDPLGGRMDGISEAETPFPHRNGSLYSVEYVLNWEDSAMEERKKKMNWMRKLYEFMAPYVSKAPRAAYLNYRDLDLGTNAYKNTSFAEAKVWGEKYFMANFRRLALVKSEVDGGNLFWNVQSVPPLN